MQEKYSRIKWERESEPTNVKSKRKERRISHHTEGKTRNGEQGGIFARVFIAPSSKSDRGPSAWERESVCTVWKSACMYKREKEKKEKALAQMFAWNTETKMKEEKTVRDTGILFRRVISYFNY